MSDATPAPNTVPRALVTGHGAFPDGLVSAVGQITGLGKHLIAFSNVGLGRDEIEAGIRAHVAEHDLQVIFTDLPGGSATLAARRVQRDTPGLTVVTGVNLAALVDFVFHDTAAADAASCADVAAAAADKGRSALVVIPSP